MFFKNIINQFSVVLLLLLSVSSFSLKGSNVFWISYPSANVTEYGIYHFRKSFDIKAEIPDSLIIHVSADNRYELYVNGKLIVYGPAAGDLFTYKYDELNIAPYLVRGKNTIAAKVFNGGKDKPLAFVGIQTGFYLKSKSPDFELNTNDTWLTYKNPAYSQIGYDKLQTWKWFYGFYACGGGDDVDGEKFPWGWEMTDYNDLLWKKAEILLFKDSNPWNLFPRNIAYMDRHLVYPKRIRIANNTLVDDNFLMGENGFTVQPNTTATVLLDFDDFTMGYPQLRVARGKNSQIKISYAESLYEKINVKAHRDSVNGKTMYGVWDLFTPDGNGIRTFRPLWKRVFRYVQLKITTKDQPVDVLSFINEYSGYPYPDKSTFTSDNDTLNRIFNMSLRTFELCSADTYYDSPYHEQLSYGGDTRVVGNISFYNSTDDRLFREMIRLYAQSENKETGLFKSAYPSRFDFDMGSWSLAWIQSIYDYYLMRADKSFVVGFMPKINGVLDFYRRNIDTQTGLVGILRNQNFVDWSFHENSMLPKHDSNGEIKQSAMLSMYYLYTLKCTIDLFYKTGFPEKAAYWKQVAQKVEAGLKKKCWDSRLKFFRDYPQSNVYTPHTNILAVLCDIIPQKNQSDFLKRVINYNKFDEKISSYFSFFLFKALEKTHNEDLFVSQLGFWKSFINRGLHTCGETGFSSQDRSDCHAWSAHPAYFIMRSICGIKSADVGFNTLIIKPVLNNLNAVSATMPHPKGKIEIMYKREGQKISGFIILPEGLNGKFEFGKQTILLKSGKNIIN